MRANFAPLRKTRVGLGEAVGRGAPLRRLIARGVLAAFCAAGFAQAAAASDFPSCLAGLGQQAAGQGVNAATFATYASGLQANDAPRFLGAQPEFKIPIWDYLGSLVDDQRVADGRGFLRTHAAAFARAEQRFGVDRHIVAAVWGVESDYGRVFGKRPVLQSLASLACSDSPRSAYFANEFFAALRIVQAGDVRPDRFFGSWAGAFGATQFMPTTFFKSAVDMEGDGRPDIVDSPADALGSAANYLRQHGWRKGLGWGAEVSLPADYQGPAGRRFVRPLSYWKAHGVHSVDGAALSGGPSALFRPEPQGGPAFLITQDFDVLRSYNESDSYALAIGLLSDRLQGKSVPQTPWANGERGLSRVERREVQTMLARSGYDVGDADGVLGEKSRAAIAGVEKRLGMSPDGWASGRLLQALQQAR